MSATRRIGQARTPGVVVITATHEARDVAVADGSQTVWIVSAGAVVGYGSSGPPRSIGWSEGLETTAPTAICAAGAAAVVAGSDGSLTVLEGDRAYSVRLASAPITDLAADGTTVYAATRDGLFVWPIGAPMAGRRLAGHDVTALALGAAGLAVGIADGSTYLLDRSGELHALASAGDEAVTAIAWSGESLWVGRAGGLERWDDGRRTRLRGDHVTALLADGHTLLVGTPDSGVLAIDEGGGERRLLGDAKVARLRRVDGRAVAVADGDVFALADGSPLVGPPPGGLASAAVSAVAILGDEVWVGGERGIDVLDEHGGWLRREAPSTAVLAIASRPESGEMVVATTDGVLLFRHGTAHRVGAREGLLGARVSASAGLVGQAAYATDQGATLIDERGVAVRLTSGVELPAGGALALAWGPGGRLFVGTAGGLAIVYEGQVEQTLAVGAVVALAVGNAGVYCATSGGLVLVKENGALERLGGPLSVNPGALAVEPSTPGERVYAGTTAGLEVFEQSWRSVRAPLPSGAVTAIVPDEAAVWIGTEQGLVRISRAVLESTLAPPRS